MTQRNESAIAWILLGAFYAGVLAVGIIAGVDHGLRRDFFGATASGLIGFGFGALGGLLGKVAAR